MQTFEKKNGFFANVNIQKIFLQNVSILKQLFCFLCLLIIESRCEGFQNLIFNYVLRAIGSFITNLETLHLGHKNFKTYSVNARSVFFTAIELI